MAVYAERSDRMTDRNNISLLANVTIGHTLVHWFQQSFPVLLAEIVASLGLGPLAAGIIMGVRSGVGAAANIPMGIFADRFTMLRTMFLTVSLAWFGVSFFLIGVAPNLLLIAVAAGILGVGAALWHPPALGLLSTRFPERRAFAMAIHGVGAGIGDLTGPIAAGALLVVLTWRDIFQITLLPALGIAVLFFLMMRGVQTGQSTGHSSLSDYLVAVRGAAKHPPLLMVLVAGGLRTAGQLTLLTFVPLYARDDLGINPGLVGVLSGLLLGPSLVSQPLLGYLADRIDRKLIIVPGVLLLAALSLVLAFLQTPVALFVAVIGIGLFMFSLATLFNALAMDNAPPDLQGTTAAAAFLSGLTLGTGAPIVAGAIAEPTGTGSAFYVAAVLFLLAALLTLRVKGGRSSHPMPRFAG